MQGMDDQDKTIPHDDMFTVSYSDSMEIRNILRTKLVQAQGRETDKIPLFVSWPGWLEDGIVCLYAGDLREILRNAVRETAHAMLGSLDGPDDEPSASAPADTEPAPSGTAPQQETEPPAGFTPRSPIEMSSAAETTPKEQSPTGMPPASGTQTAGPDSETAAPGNKPQKTAAPGTTQPQTLGNILGQDDIEELIREEMNRKKR